MACDFKTYSKGGGRHCSVRGCTYNEKKLSELCSRLCFDHCPQLKRDCPCDPPYRFYSPKDQNERREWLSRLQLKNPPKYLYVCSFHFVDKQPTEQNHLPQLLLGHERLSVKKPGRILVRSTAGQGPEGVERGKRKASTAPECTIPEKRFQDEASSDSSNGGGHDTFKQHQSASSCGEIDQTINGSHLFGDSELNSTVDWKVNLLEGVTSTLIRNGVLPVPEEARDAPQNVQVNEVQVHTENDGAPDSQCAALDVTYAAPDIQCEAPDVQPIAASQPQHQKAKASALKGKTRDLNQGRASKKKRKSSDSELWNDYLRSEIDKNKEFTALAKVARLWFTKNLGTHVEESTTFNQTH